MTTTYVQATDWPYMDRDGHRVVVLDTARDALVAAGWTPPAELNTGNQPEDGLCGTETQPMKAWPTQFGGCRACDHIITAKLKADGDWMTATSRPMIVCADCGNKRCPKAADHRNECTASNEPGQPGSDYYPSAKDILGIAPDWTGGLSVDEYMREQRER